jgi:hypothetical protein
MSRLPFYTLQVSTAKCTLLLSFRQDARDAKGWLPATGLKITRKLPGVDQNNVQSCEHDNSAMTERKPDTLLDL